MHRLLITALCLAAAALAYGAESGSALARPERSVFAVVGKTAITIEEYDAAYAVIQRRRYYHRQVPEARQMALRREVGDALIDRVLLGMEAKRRGIAPDQSNVLKQLASYEQRYRSSPQWSKIQAEMLPALTRDLERQSMLDQLEANVRRVKAPDDTALRGYYAKHTDRFTEPEQVKLSLILLRVDPSSPKAVWLKAQEEAAAIRARIVRGADFASLAKLHSADPSAERGGDMGYLHRGMVPEALHQELDRLGQATLSEPIRVLEGIALIRIEDRKPAQLRKFEDVRERAAQLWQREESDRHWNAFRAELRKGAAIQIVDVSRYPAQAASGPQ